MKRGIALAVVLIAASFLFACGEEESVALGDGAKDAGKKDAGSSVECEKNSECKEDKFCIDFKCVEPPEDYDKEACEKCEEKKEDKQVCGKDGKTYPNQCIAGCLGIELDYEGECKKEEDDDDNDASDDDDNDADDDDDNDASDDDDSDTDDDDDNDDATECIDNDGDGYGEGCEAGPDCRDDVKAINPGMSELCNGVDDNCNDIIDEGYNIGTECSAGVGGCLRAGKFICDPNDDLRSICDAVPGEPEAELCGDGIDNNCDGNIDEGFDVGADCVSGVGVCERKGKKVCSEDGLTTVCDAVPGEPSPFEICGNDLDDDCNGTTDDGCECETGEIRTCGTNEGICEEGEQECINGRWSACLGGKKPDPRGEICGDNLDNDCDGEVDEGFGVGEECVSGLGICARTGKKKCSEDGLGTTCDATPGKPADEVCNRLDDNCDGVVDDGDICAYSCERIGDLPGKIGWWKLDEADAEKTIVDATGLNPDGELKYGGKRVDTGFCNRGINFAEGGTSARTAEIQMEKSFPATGTIFAVFKPSKNDPEGTILQKGVKTSDVSKRKIFSIYIERSWGKYQICLGHEVEGFSQPGSLCATYSFLAGRWYSVKASISYEGDKYVRRLEIDGKEVKKDEKNTGFDDKKAVFSIGNEYITTTGWGGFTSPFPGVVDEVVLY